MNQDVFEKFINSDDGPLADEIYADSDGNYVIELNESNRDAVGELACSFLIRRNLGKACPVCGKTFDTPEDCRDTGMWVNTFIHKDCFERWAAHYRLKPGSLEISLLICLFRERRWFRSNRLRDELPSDHSRASVNQITRTLGWLHANRLVSFRRGWWAISIYGDRACKGELL